MQKFPENAQIIKCHAMAAYGIQKFCANSQEETYMLSEKKGEGKIGPIQFAMKEMQLKDIHVFVSRYIWLLSYKFPNIDYLKRMRKLSLMEAAIFINDNALKFKEKLDTNDSLNEKRFKENQTKNNYLAYAYLPFMNDSSFKKIFKYGVIKRSEVIGKRKRRKVEKDEILVSKGKGHVNNLLMINPRYYHLDKRKTIDQQFLKSDAKQREIREGVVSLAKAIDIELTILDSREKGVLNTEKFNEYALSVDWLRERILYFGSDYIGFYSQYITELQAKYGSDHLAINSIWNVTDHKKFNATALAASAFFFYTLPIYLVWQLTPSHTMEYVFVVFDLKTGNLVYADGKMFSSKYRKEILNAHIYNSLNQLK